MGDFIEYNFFVAKSILAKSASNFPEDRRHSIAITTHFEKITDSFLALK